MSKPDPVAELRKLVGSRIRQARQMAGFETISDLSARFPDWSDSRLGNYENGVSMPGPLDILRLSEATDTSPCWIQFGIGSIRSAARDIQAIRHQNLTHLWQQLNRAEQAALRRALKLKPREFDAYRTNPFHKLPERLCRKIERHLGHTKGWMDQQHIDSDGLSAYFPDDLRELMSIYSELDERDRAMLLALARVVGAPDRNG